MKHINMIIKELGYKKFILATLVFSYFGGAAFYWGANININLVFAFAFFANYFLAAQLVTGFIYQNQYGYKIKNGYKRSLLSLLIHYILVTVLLLINQVSLQLNFLVLGPFTFGAVYSIIYQIYFTKILTKL